MKYKHTFQLAYLRTRDAHGEEDATPLLTDALAEADTFVEFLRDGLKEATADQTAAAKKKVADVLSTIIEKKKAAPADTPQDTLAQVDAELTAEKEQETESALVRGPETPEVYEEAKLADEDGEGADDDDEGDTGEEADEDSADATDDDGMVQVLADPEDCRPAPPPAPAPVPPPVPRTAQKNSAPVGKLTKRQKKMMEAIIEASTTSADGCTSYSSIAKRMDCSNPAATQMVAVLEEKGYVSKGRNGQLVRIKPLRNPDGSELIPTETYVNEDGVPVTKFPPRYAY